MVVNSDYLDDLGVSMAMGLPQNGWFIKEYPIKKDDLRVPIF